MTQTCANRKNGTKLKKIFWETHVKTLNEIFESVVRNHFTKRTIPSSRKLPGSPFLLSNVASRFTLMVSEVFTAFCRMLSMRAKVRPVTPFVPYIQYLATLAVFHAAQRSQYHRM